MDQEISGNEIKTNHNQECACGCSNAYDQIDDQQFENSFDLNILSKKQIAIAVFIPLALIALIYFLV